MSWAFAGAVYGYRGQAAEAEQWYERVEILDDRSPCGWLVRCLRADVEMHHGRMAQAQQIVQRPSRDAAGRWRSLYAAVRAEAFGGDELEEAAALVGDDAHATAILARAQRKLEVAQEAFRQCGAIYQWARTTLLMDGPDGDEALATYERLGLEVAGPRRSTRNRRKKQALLMPTQPLG